MEQTRPGVPRPVRDIATVRVIGDVDRSGLEACDYLIAQAGDHIAGAVVDLTRATHLDYRATTILVARRRVLKARGAELAVAASRVDIRNIVRASAGAEIQIFASVDEAAAYVRGDADLVTVTKQSRSTKPVRPA